MGVILSIETASSVCSAAIHQDGALLAVEEQHTPQSAASQLAVQIEKLFSTTGVSTKDLEAVAVSIGPGSYTGLRIGVATAKGLCYGCDVPLIALDSLFVLAAGLKQVTTRLLCPMMDARRMEVYYSLLDQNLFVIEKSIPLVIDELSFADRLANDSILFFGSGAAKCKGVINSPNARFDENAYASAAYMGQAAFDRFQKKQFEDLAALEPNYLKEFKAKTKMV